MRSPVSVLILDMVLENGHGHSIIRHKTKDLEVLHWWVIWGGQQKLERHFQRTPQQYRWHGEHQFHLWTRHSLPQGWHQCNSTGLLQEHPHWPVPHNPLNQKLDWSDPCMANVITLSQKQGMRRMKLHMWTNHCPSVDSLSGLSRMWASSYTRGLQNPPPPPPKQKEETHQISQLLWRGSFVKILEQWIILKHKIWG